MTRILVELGRQLPAGRRRTEHVERKGLGHPDTICDSVMEAASLALCREYLAACGRVLHHNIDKGLLVAGQSAPRLGGGEILAPMRLVFGDRATAEVGGRRLPIGEIVVEAARRWLRRNLRLVDPERHVVYQNEILPGSPELVDNFARETLGANDTSAAVGYAPLTETERLVLETERLLNSEPFKARHPEVGEDIKVMAVREDRRLSLTVAAAFVDRFVPDARTYADCKASVCDEVRAHIEPELRDIDSLEVALNTLDDPRRGEQGMYLTVLGTSAEGADGGQVGRGNRVNGLISLHRPMSTEAAAGKNPVSHVGKIYNQLASRIAHHICESVPGVEESTVWLCSQIGRPLDDPWSTAVELVTAPDVLLDDVEPLVATVVAEELSRLSELIGQLVRGELPVC